MLRYNLTAKNFNKMETDRPMVNFYAIFGDEPLTTESNTSEIDSVHHRTENLQQLLLTCGIQFPYPEDKLGQIPLFIMTLTAGNPLVGILKKTLRGEEIGVKILKDGKSYDFANSKDALEFVFSRKVSGVVTRAASDFSVTGTTSF